MKRKDFSMRIHMIIRIVAVTAVLCLFPMCTVLAADEDAKSTDYGQQVAEQTAPRFKAIDYKNNETIIQLLAPTYYTTAEKYNKKTEIAKRDGKNISMVTDAEAIRELQKDYIVMAYGQSFENVLRDIEQIIAKIVNNLIVTDMSSDPVFALENNSEKILVGLVYLDRMYNFEMGGQNIRDVLMYNPDCYGKKMSRNQLSWLIQIGNAGADNLKISNAAGMFGSGRVFTNNITSAATLTDFLEENRQKFMPDTTLDDWFVQESHAFITQRGSTSGLYSRMWADETLQTHILPLLNVSENSIYMIVNPATITYGIVDCYVDRDLKDSNPALYEADITQFRQTLESAANQQYEFIKLLNRLAKPAVKGLLSTNRVAIDSLRLYNDNPYANASADWSERFGDHAASGVNEFITPLNMYVTYMFVDGEATGYGLRFYVSKALTERGLSTYNHEMTHLLISSVLLNQYGIRDGIGSEVYTRGMFETYELYDPPSFNLNLIYDRSGNNSRFHNATPERFQTDKDLQDYMQGILDVIYTLDYAEANAILGKTDAQKQKWFHKLSQIDDTGNRVNPGSGNYQHKLDEIGELTLAEAGQLNSLEDLIDHNIIASRYQVVGRSTTGTFASNGYYVIPLFSANYAGVQNSQGVSGDIMIRRQAFELLAEYGYYDGMVPYISNQYKTDAANEGAVLSDTYILNKIFNGQYATMADFKKGMFQKRIDKTAQLRPVMITWDNQQILIDNFDTLSRLMSEAVESDLQNVTIVSGSTNNISAGETQVERLKAAIYKAYLNLTNDFTDSIYQDGQSSSNTGSTDSSTGDDLSGTGGEKLPDTAVRDASDFHLTVFCILAALTLCTYSLKQKYGKEKDEG